VGIFKKDLTDVLSNTPTEVKIEKVINQQIFDIMKNETLKEICQNYPNQILFDDIVDFENFDERLSIVDCIVVNIIGKGWLFVSESIQVHISIDFASISHLAFSQLA